jgi:hypothetical protein
MQIDRKEQWEERLWRPTAADSENLSPGQREELDGVYHSYPYFNGDALGREHRDAWR